MPETLIKKPKFKSEAEEAAWYPANPDYVRQQLQLAQDEGRLTHGTADSRLGLTIPVTIRLNKADLAKARAQAEARLVPYQTYLKILLHQALANAETETSAAKSVTA
jgi:predicted DNA binding CopG/RHH family protein